jgi:hypothetical protein
MNEIWNLQVRNGPTSVNRRWHPRKLQRPLSSKAVTQVVSGKDGLVPAADFQCRPNFAARRPARKCLLSAKAATPSLLLHQAGRSRRAQFANMHLLKIGRRVGENRR